MHRITMQARRTTAILCMMLLPGGTALAQQPEMETRSIQVSLKGVDLSTAAGQSQARARIVQAVRRVYRALNIGSVTISSQDFVARSAAQDATRYAAMSRLNVLIAAATQPKPWSSFAVASAVPAGGSASSR